MTSFDHNYLISGFRQNGDCSVLIDYLHSTDPNLLAHIHAFATELRQQSIPNLVNVLPAKTSIMLAFSTPVDELTLLCDQIQTLNSTFHADKQQPAMHEIPICYHPDLGVDLEAVLSATSLSLDKFITIHSQQEYSLGMLGFLPGFIYLDNLDPRISMPRKSTPSVSLAAGSVAIAGNQCGIYSLRSPGGWWVIGRTPICLFDHTATEPVKIQPLDKVCFKPISLEAFKRYQTGSKL